MWIAAKCGGASHITGEYGEGHSAFDKFVSKDSGTPTVSYGIFRQEDMFGKSSAGNSCQWSREGSKGHIFRIFLCIQLPLMMFYTTIGGWMLGYCEDGEGRVGKGRIRER